MSDMPLGEIHKTTIQESKSHVASPFELIHVDIWGAYRVSTRIGHKYFLTIVDDCTRATSVHLLKYKLDFYNAIQEFVQFV